MTADTTMPILVVDDYQTMVRIIRNLLKQIGFENVDDAANGEDALRKIREKSYGLIISDWNMEPMTGFQLLQKVRETRGACDTPFIMVTAESKTDNVVAARRAGVSHYIVKPFNAADLEGQDRRGLLRRRRLTVPVGNPRPKPRAGYSQAPAFIYPVSRNRRRAASWLPGSSALLSRRRGSDTCRRRRSARPFP